MYISAIGIVYVFSIFFGNVVGSTFTINSHVYREQTMRRYFFGIYTLQGAILFSLINFIIAVLFNAPGNLGLSILLNFDILVKRGTKYG